MATGSPPLSSPSCILPSTSACRSEKFTNNHKLLLYLHFRSVSLKKVYLDSLVTKSKQHVVRVKVIHKRTFPPKEGKQTFQRLLLVDEKGHTMRAALFGHNVDYFDEIIDVETCYDISNVVVAPVNDKVYEHYPDEKQMHINTLSLVKRLPVAEVPYPLIFNCTQILELPRDHVPLNVSFVVVLEYVPPRKVPNKFSSKLSDLSELRITDDSCSEVLHVSLYNDFALGLEILANVEPRQAVILLSGLKTKLSPESISIPKWKGRTPCDNDNHDMILSRSSISMKETTMSQVPMSTIECAMQIKANEITREEMVRISGFIPDFNDHSVRVSVCCNWCGKACENNLEEPYFWDSCNQHAVATTKLFFDFTVTDGTGSLKLVAHTKNAEQLLKTKASVVYAMTTEERFNFIAELGTMFRATKTEMLLSPVVILLEDHKVVKWILKYII